MHSLAGFVAASERALMHALAGFHFFYSDQARIHAFTGEILLQHFLEHLKSALVL
jgi:hypothetical protein